MKVSWILLGVVLFIAFAVFQAHADQMGDLCSILNTAKNRQAVLSRQIANERNPLKQDSLQQQLRQIDQQKAASLDNFWKVNNRKFTNFTGVVSSFDAMHYNKGPGVMLEITLPCEVKIAFQFIEVTNPAWGNLDPQKQTPLSMWRAALENIMKGDSVTFSGRLVPDSNSFAVMTELRKKGGIAYKVPDPYLPPTTGTFSNPTVTQGGLIWMPPTFVRNWAGANDYCQGMSGWRLPTQMEVQVLAKSGAINGRGWFSPGGGQAAWTSTSAGPDAHITVYFQNGSLHALGDKYNMKVTCVRVADAAPASAPSFPQSMLYRDVRAKLVEMGWQPFKLPSAEGCTWDNCRDFPETLACYGVGRAPCIFTWKRGKTLLKVVAVGEGDQTFDSAKSCNDIVENLTPMGGWDCK